MHLVVTDLREKYCLNIPAVGPKHGSTKPATATSGALILAVLSALLLMAAHPAHAQTETVLYSFGSQSGDGASPYDTPIMDKEGNLYGTTLTGGTVNWGTVFKVTSSGEESVLYSFGSQSGDGDQPYAGLVMDKKGNLYGTTAGNGAHGAGTVFKATPSGEESVFYSFGSKFPDGYEPYAGLIIDKKGNLYGTTVSGGTNHLGNVFKVTSSGQESVLYSFGSQSGDGEQPYAGLIMDKEGNLYGTTSGGGAYDSGIVFKVTPTGEETVLHSFCSQGGSYCPDGCFPLGGLIMDKKGNLYGTTNGCGASNSGTVFKLTPEGTVSVLYSFGNGPNDGYGPNAALIMDKKGSLYGTTSGGFPESSCYGTVFEVTPAGGGTVLHNFIIGTGDGLTPYGGLAMDTKGNLYGTTSGGGANNQGTVFKVAR
jgi:uncharacterized repeat protein (TIGR03803 family)